MSANAGRNNLCDICYQPCLPPPIPSNPFQTVTVRYEDDVLWGGKYDQVHRRCLDAIRAVATIKP